jgi:NodT family efflux transporter outer membrane factor (OMF) lipoprotein
MKLFLTAAAALAVLAGCAAVPGPSAESATPAAPASWQAPSWQGGVPLRAPWWASFDEPALATLVPAAERASASLSSARARLAAAQAARSAAASLLAPRAQASGSALRGRDEPGGDIANVFGVGVQASWELDLFGGRRAAEQAAASRLQAASADADAARIAVVADTVGSVIALRACEARAAQADADAQSRAETSRLTGLTAQAGFTAPAEAALARAGAAQARSQALQQRAACEQALKALVALTGLDEPALRRALAAGRARVPQPAALALDAVPAALLQQRPDLVAAARRVAAAAADRREADAGLLPQLSLTGSVSRSRIEAPGFSTTGNVWSFGPLQLTVPLFDSGQRRAAVVAAAAAYDDAVQQYAAALRGAVREVEDALVALDASAARRADAQAAAADFESALKAADARQRGGLASLFELEDARRNALAARGALIDLDRERATAWVSLARALGGGWSPDPARLTPDATPSSASSASPGLIQNSTPTRTAP